VSSCAVAARPIVSVPANEDKPSHQSVTFQNGTLELYPNVSAPTSVIFTEQGGAVIFANCSTEDCSSLALKIKGQSVALPLPQGDYQLLQTSDPRLVQVNDGTGREQLGYLAKNDGDSDRKFFPGLPNGAYKVFPDEQAAEAYEHKGDDARLAGKIALYTLAGVLIVGLIAGGLYLDEQANTTTTKCTSTLTSATCKTTTGLF
jgi:hypothetical protein